ncbi:MAG: ABC transporter substrate-binding protein, partial [Proteobacteria bacterium]|nr:ABC transporter substrate-binding protein [Pseudomonadota bacterium]
MRDRRSNSYSSSRRGFMRTGLGVAGGLALPMGYTQLVWAADRPPIGTWPAGSQGDTVYIGAAVPLTGTYAVQGEDELKGMELAVEHMNTNHELMKKIAPKVNNGVLGKKVKLLSADSAAKPNQALQVEQTFINEHKVIL